MTIGRMYWPLAIIAAVLTLVVAANLAPYGRNPTAPFHMDTNVAESNPVREGVVVLDVPAYDGAHYYQAARNVPAVFTPSRWNELTTQQTTSYSYQRFLLPLAAFILSLGQEPLLPYAFLFIHLGSLVLAGWLLIRAHIKPLYALAITLSPAAMVGLHFSLAEPLTLLLLTAFLLRFSKTNAIRWPDLLLLAGIVVAREVNILFVGALMLHFLWRREWKHLLLMAVPIVVFIALQGLLYEIFGEIPFLMSAGKRTLPFEAMWQLVSGGYGYNRLTLTSIPLAVLFVTPALLWTGWLFVKNNDRSFLTLGAFLFLLLMTTMPDHIWGSITSIGRVITPVYPLALLVMAKHDSWTARTMALFVLVIGIGAAISLASVIHPYHLS